MSRLPPVLETQPRVVGEACLSYPRIPHSKPRKLKARISTTIQHRVIQQIHLKTKTTSRSHGRLFASKTKTREFATGFCLVESSEVPVEIHLIDLWVDVLDLWVCVSNHFGEVGQRAVNREESGESGDVRPNVVQQNLHPYRRTNSIFSDFIIFIHILWIHILFHILCYFQKITFYCLCLGEQNQRSR